MTSSVKYISSITILLCFIASPVLSQPTITGAVSNYKVGNSYNVHRYDHDNFNPGASGANVTWDFSGLSSSSMDTWEFLSSSTHTAGPDYPAANCYSDDGSNASFWNMSTSEWAFIGGLLSSGNIIESYTDKREMVIFPMTFGTVYNETFSGTHENTLVPVTYDRGGTITLEADGYGTLIMPYGTIHNCLRLKGLTQYDDKISGTTVSEYVDTYYYWYHPDLEGPIITFHDFEIVGSLVSKSGVYLDESFVGVDNPDFQVNDLMVFPVPAKDVLTIKYDLNERHHVSIQMKDITGRDVLPISNFRDQNYFEQSIDVSSLSEGTYILQLIVNNTHVVNKKVTIQ